MAATTMTTSKGHGALSRTRGGRKPLGFRDSSGSLEQGQMFESDAKDATRTSTFTLRADRPVDFQILEDSSVRIDLQAIIDLANLCVELMKNAARSQDCDERFVEISQNGFALKAEVRAPHSMNREEFSESLRNRVQDSLAMYKAVSDDPLGVARRVPKDKIKRIDKALKQAKATKQILGDIPLGLTMSVDGGEEKKFHISPAKAETKDALLFVACRLEPEMMERQIVITEVLNGQYVYATYEGSDPEKYRLPSDYKATVHDEITVLLRPKKERQLELFMDVVRVVGLPGDS